MSFTSQQNSTDRSKFVFIGDHPAIDFVNTLAMSEEQLTDHLCDWSDVICWLSITGLSTEAHLQISSHGQKQAVANMVELRRGWKAELDRLIAGGKVSRPFVEKLNHLLSEDSFHEILRSDKNGGFALDQSTSRLAGENLALALLARQISHFLAEANLAYLHRCANTTSCVLYFYDTTKNHRRQWCSVETCGNRHKVAEFRRRKAIGRK